MAERRANQFAAGQALERLGASLAGRYRIETLIGVGGMSVVYAGRHRNGHPVAIKMLHERFRDSYEEASIRREARLANEIGHRVVVPVIDDDVTEDGRIFLVMPLLRGETLRARANRFGGRLPPAEVASVANALLGALAAADALGIVHRDVKPENVFVTEDGAVRLLDFGIGRVSRRDDDAAATRPGSVVGTPAFMAPEQALGRGEEIDGRTDLWGLGATMYTLLSGRLVHETATAAEATVLAATQPARPLGEAAPNVPGALRDVVDRALAFRRDERWQNAAEMARALEEACEASFGEPITGLPALTVPRDATATGPDALPTERPSTEGANAESADHASAPLLRTTTTAVAAASRRPGIAAERTPERREARAGRRSRRTLAAASLAFIGVLVGVVATFDARVSPGRASLLDLGRAARESASTEPAREMVPIRADALAAPSLPRPVDSAPAPPAGAAALAAKPILAAAHPSPRPRVSKTVATAPNCDPPYSLDAAGHRVYKPECD